VNDFVSKVSQGAINNINLFAVSNLSLVIEKLKKSNYWIYVTTLNEKSVNINKITFDKKSCIVFGNENSGFSSLIQKNADFCIKIPMIGSSQSLNVAVSVGIVLSHLVK